MAKWRLQNIFHASTSAEYEAWKRQFLSNRLRLCLWIALLCHLSFAAIALDKLVLRPQTEDIQQTLKILGNLANYKSLKQSVLLSDGVVVLFLMMGLGLRRTAWGRTHPRMGFLFLSGSMTLIPEVLGTVIGLPLPLKWEFIFMAQVVLLPVYWQLHLLVQSVALLYYFGINSILGFAKIPGLSSLFGLETILYAVWICLICDIAVYLYDRLRYHEFESRRELQLFIHAVTHDLRIPVLGTAIVLKKMLQKADVADGKVIITTSKLEQLLAGSDRQLNLINSILVAYKTEHYALRLNCQPLHLRNLVDSVVADLATLLEQNQVILNNHISERLFLVQADADQLWRVFSNLITNAALHNPNGIHITLDATLQTAKNLRCTVQDNGIGIPLQQQCRLFELYYRGEQSRYSPGLGLGLYLCQLRSCTILNKDLPKRTKHERKGVIKVQMDGYGNHRKARPRVSV